MADTPRQRHTPVRSCIACRERADKRDLIRVVRAPDGSVAVDTTGRMNGRGAYLHARQACWELALRRGTIERALRLSSIAPGERDALVSYSLTLS
jgi:predicted RNA-binding protein YlxR (DUF448 family)